MGAVLGVLSFGISAAPAAASPHLGGYGCYDSEVFGGSVIFTFKLLQKHKYRYSDKRAKHDWKFKNRHVKFVNGPLTRAHGYSNGKYHHIGTTPVIDLTWKFDGNTFKLECDYNPNN